MGMMANVAEAVEPEVRIGVVLRILSGSIYLELILIFGIARASVYELFDKTVDINLRRLKLSRLRSQEDCVQYSTGFLTSQSPSSPLMGFVGAGGENSTAS